MNTQERNLTFLTVTVAAGATEKRNATGARLWVIESDGELLVRIGNRTEVPLNLGFKVEEDFSELTFRNANAYDVTIQILYGTAEFVDGRFNVVATRPNQFVRFVESPATIWETVDAITTPLAATTVSAEQSGVATTTRGRRKFALISNADATNGLWVMSSTNFPDDALLYVPAGAQMRLDTDSSLYIYNPNGVTVAYVLSSCFYTAVHA